VLHAIIAYILGAEVQIGDRRVYFEGLRDVLRANVTDAVIGESQAGQRGVGSEGAGEVQHALISDAVSVEVELRRVPSREHSYPA